MRERRSEAGAVAVVASLFVSVVALVLASLIVDTGYAKGQRRQAQAAADAAALAGADEIVAMLRRGQDPQSTASRASVAALVKSSAGANWSTTAAQWTGCSAVLPAGGYQKLVTSDPNNCISVNWTTHRVRVRVPARSMPAFFAKKAMITGATAEAAWSETLPACGLCVLGTTTHSIGNGNVLVSDANVDFNGSVTTNANNGSVSVAGGQLNIQNSTGTSGTFNQTPTFTGTAIADPLASFQMPTLPTNHPTGGPCTGGPGVYGDWDSFNGCVLQPGLYVITGLWKMTASGEQLFGNGVTLYFTCATSTGAPRECAPNESGGTLEQNGGTLKLSAPAAPSPTAGLLIMYSRNNTATLKLRGNGATTYTGTIYGPSSTLDINGMAGAATVDSLIIVNDLALGGQNGYVSTTYTQSNNMSVPGGVALVD